MHSLDEVASLELEGPPSLNCLAPPIDIFRTHSNPTLVVAGEGAWHWHDTPPVCLRHMTDNLGNSWITTKAQAMPTLTHPRKGSTMFCREFHITTERCRGHPQGNNHKKPEQGRLLCQKTLPISSKPRGTRLEGSKVMPNSMPHAS